MKGVESPALRVESQRANLLWLWILDSGLSTNSEGVLL